MGVGESSYPACLDGSCTRPIIIFVHLGSNPSKTLKWSALQVKENNRNIHLCLITDSPLLFADFPGTVFNYSRTNLNKGLEKFKKTNRAFKRISGGYWSYTTERLFALEELANFFSVHHPVIHLESDVLLIASDLQLNWVVKKIEKTSVVRYSQSDGIASILISPSVIDLQDDLKLMGTILEENRHIFSDMELLGTSLNKGILEELPGSPDNAWEIENNANYAIFFDGAAFGQYLFGLDPVHTENTIVSGYVNPNCDFNLKASKWELKNPREYDGQCLAIVSDDLVCFPLCLHIHSKILVETPSVVSKFWIDLLSDVNSGVTSITKYNDVNGIHANNLKFFDRLSMFLYRRIKSFRK